MKKIIIEAIAPEQARLPCYCAPNSGDWFYDQKGDLHITVQAQFLHDEACLIALHEWIEAWLCRKARITQPVVDAFDQTYTKDTEPGDDPKAPYRRQHRRACLIEFLMADFLGMVGYGRME
jgi:hypothetical protein